MNSLYNLATPTQETSKPQLFINLSAGPLTVSPSIIGLIPYTLSLTLMSASFIPFTWRIVPIDTIGFDGHIIIFLAFSIYSITLLIGLAFSIPRNSTSRTSGSHLCFIKYSSKCIVSLGVFI